MKNELRKKERKKQVRKKREKGKNEKKMKMKRNCIFSLKINYLCKSNSESAN